MRGISSIGTYKSQKPGEAIYHDTGTTPKLGSQGCELHHPRYSGMNNENARLELARVNLNSSLKAVRLSAFACDAWTRHSTAPPQCVGGGV